MELTGKIYLIQPTVQASEKFQRRNLILEDASNPMYPQYITVEFTQDKTALLDQFKAGQTVTVNINIKGRKWVSPQGEEKYFNTIEGWRIVAGDAAPSQLSVPNKVDEMSKMGLLPGEEDDTLPF